MRASSFYDGSFPFFSFLRCEKLAGSSIIQPVYYSFIPFVFVSFVSYFLALVFQVKRVTRAAAFTMDQATIAQEDSVTTVARVVKREVVAVVAASLNANTCANPAAIRRRTVTAGTVATHHPNIHIPRRNNPITVDGIIKLL